VPDPGDAGSSGAKGPKPPRAESPAEPRFRSLGARPSPASPRDRALPRFPDPARAGFFPDPERAGGFPDPARAGFFPDPERAGFFPDPERAGFFPDPERAGFFPDPERAGGFPDPARTGFFPPLPARGARDRGSRSSSASDRDTGASFGVGGRRLSGRRANEGAGRRTAGALLENPAATYSPRGLPPKYHRRGRSSLPCSEWERVFPRRYSHRKLVVNVDDPRGNDSAEPSRTP
jgi:hypothetical protein